MTNRPSSASAALTGLAGLAALAISIAALTGTGWPIHLKAMIIVAATAAAMIAVDTLCFRTYRNPSTGVQSGPVRKLHLERVARKLIGLIVTLAILAAIYWIVPEYRRDFYAPYWSALSIAMPVLLAAAPFYIAYVDRRQQEPEDVYAEIGALILTGTLPTEMNRLRQHTLGWAVKGFFLPLMFTYSCATLGSLFASLGEPQPFQFLRWHAVATDILFMVDVLIAVVGYVFTLRLIDNHIRSTEPTLFGWLVCLACYPPLNKATGAYLDYETGTNWTTLLQAWPALQAAWGIAILLCLFIFVWSTVSFGLRFSNLTHRGIITSGPYRWTKHPAYISKNIAWWLISMPFLAEAGPAEGLRHSLILLALNGVYALRAFTEERHLSRDPDYVAYSAYIAEHGILARLKRLRAAVPQTGFTQLAE